MIDVLLDLERSMISSLNWSLFDLDRTDVVSIMDFIRRTTEVNKSGSEQTKRVCIDQVDW